MKVPTLGQYVRGHRGAMAGAVVSTVLAVCLNLVLPFIVGFAVDGLADGSLHGRALLRLLAWFGAAAAVASVFSFLMRMVPVRLSHRIEFDIRRDLFAHLATLEQAYFRETRTGDLMTRMVSDLAMVRDFIGQGMLQGMRALTVAVLAFAVMFWTSPSLTLVLLVMFPAMILMFFFFIRAIRRRHEAVQELYGDLSDYTQETVAGIRTVKSFVLEPRRQGHFDGLNRMLVRKNLGLSMVQQPLWPLFAFWFGAATVALLVFGGRQVIRGELTLGELVRFQQYLLYMQWPILSVGWTASLVQRGRASWERILRVFARAPAIADPAPEGGPSPHASLRGDIHFDGVSYAVEDRRLLADIHLVIRRGETLAVTGPTGAGKTLLVSLLPRLIDPTAGAVRIGGRDVRTVPLADVRAAIGMAAQEPVLFSDTLAQNLAFGLCGEKEDDVLWAADIAHLHEDIDGFPDRYATVLGERGVTLSGGQRQRASIGRAVARRPEILILDDVLASVDTRTEAEILRKLRPLMSRCTTLLVSHRISALREADRVVVLDQGRIVQCGTPGELLAQPGYYRDLAALQELEHRMEEAP